jgi:hypothetical protein
VDKDSEKTWDKKIAIAIIHGAGAENPNFAEGLMAAIRKEFANLVKGVAVDSCLKFKPIHWAPILEQREKDLWNKMETFNLSLMLKFLRKFIVSYFADAVAYQPSTSGRTVYDDVHVEVAKSLSCLAREAGGNAPLCVIGHSLGTVITSNYFYDISQPNLISYKVQKEMRGSLLEQGRTLVLVYTLGCPIALWSIRFPGLHKPISVPANTSKQLYPPVEGEWINFYERHDIFSFPLSNVIDPKIQSISDYPVKIGNFISHRIPTCHHYYWTNREVAAEIAKGLAKTWCSLNGRTFETPERKCSFSNKKSGHSTP